MTARRADGRSPDRLRHHYEVEKALAERLRNSSRDERATLYTQLYDDLFRQVTDHPQLSKKSRKDAGQKQVAQQVRRLTRYCDASSSYLEIGAGECRLALAMAERVCKVYAIDISTEIIRDIKGPDNFEVLLSDGTNLPVPAESVSLAYSDQLIEHLHPEDVTEHLERVRECLKPGGCYFCVTPNRLTGPHDISGQFDDVASGFHLREYTYSDLSKLIYAAGFRRVSIIMSLKGSATLRLPLRVMTAVEQCYALLPVKFRKSIRFHPVVQKILGIEVIATK